VSWMVHSQMLEREKSRDAYWYASQFLGTRETCVLVRILIFGYKGNGNMFLFSKPPYLLTRIVKFWISGRDAWELISSLVNLPPFLICAGKKAVWEITFFPGSIREPANSSKKHHGCHAPKENDCKPDVGRG
jgi:hypothetical protein